jgi:hypothetical protein
LLPGFGAKHAKKVVSIWAEEKCVVAFHAVGNPATARHTRESMR